MSVVVRKIPLVERSENKHEAKTRGQSYQVGIVRVVLNDKELINGVDINQKGVVSVLLTLSVYINTIPLSVCLCRISFLLVLSV